MVGVIVAAAAVASVVYAFARSNHATTQPSAAPYTSVTPASANELNAEALAVARRWANANFVEFDCSLVRSLSAAQAGFEQSYGLCEDNQAGMLSKRSRNRRVTLHVKRRCSPTDALLGSVYKKSYDCIVVRAEDIECGLSSERVGQKVIKFWAPGSSTDEIFLRHVGSSWRVVGEEPIGASGGGGNLGRC